MMKSTSTPSLNVSKENSADIMSGVQKSYTTSNCVVEKKRGFKPSDRHDPTKKQFLTHLSQQIWQKRNEYTNASKNVDLHKIFTPATDAEEILPKNRKLYASSAFYSPTLHPTVEDQVELARRISHSLSDISNQQSKGQSMYMNRKKRSVKWVHEGSGQDLYMPKEISLECYAPPSVADASAQSSANEKSQCSTYKPLNASPAAYSLPEYSPGTGGSSTFPVRNPHQQGFSSMFCNNTPPNQQHLPPQSYQEIPQNTSQNDCQFYLNPSPLPYNKLAKFENQSTDECRNFYSPPSHDSCLKIRSTKVRNTSPAPFSGSYNRPYTPSYDNHCYGGTPSPSFIPLSINQHNTPNLLHTRVTSNQILNAPSYNSSARGWVSGGCAAEGSQILPSFTNPTKLKVANALCIPYTDF